MLITPQLALVGDSQFGLSSRYDCHVYAVRGPDGVVLIDSGSGLAEDEILGHLQAAFPEEPVRAIVITHAHADHFAGAASLQRRWHCPVLAPALTRAVVEQGDEEGSGLRQARSEGGYPANLHLQPCPVSRSYGEGDRLALAGLEFQVIAVRGHSDDSSCLLVEIAGKRVLFSADVVFYGGVLGVINSRDSGMQGYRSDLAKLAGLRVDMLFPGHGIFTLKRGQDHLDLAIEKSRKGFLPRLIGQGDAIF
jgi:hydroxyacylglutathione hydrolase